jgi:hypothetical protein
LIFRLDAWRNFVAILLLLFFLHTAAAAAAAAAASVTVGQHTV